MALLQFFDEMIIEVNHQLYFNFLAKDEKRTKKPELLVNRHDVTILQEKKQRQ